MARMKTGQHNPRYHAAAHRMWSAPVRALWALVILATVPAIVSSCCTIGIGCKKPPEGLSLQWMSDPDCNEGRTVNSMWFLLADPSTFQTTSAAALFDRYEYRDIYMAMQKAAGVSADAPDYTWWKQQVIAPDEVNQMEWQPDLSDARWKDRALYLCVVANFANPPSDFSDRAIIQLNGDEEVKLVRVRFYRNSIDVVR